MYYLKGDAMEKPNYLEGWYERMAKFIEEVRPVYEEMSAKTIIPFPPAIYEGREIRLGEIRTPNEEQKERIRKTIKKWAKTSDEEGRFLEQARQVWEAW